MIALAVGGIGLAVAAWRHRALGHEVDSSAREQVFQEDLAGALRAWAAYALGLAVWTRRYSLRGGPATASPSTTFVSQRPASRRARSRGARRGNGGLA